MASDGRTTGELPATLGADETRDLAGLATPVISDQLDRLDGLGGLTRYGGGKLVGTALTVRTRPGDNLGFYHALALMQPGHVLVVDGGGDLNNALCGDLMRAYAVSRGCAGFVVEGAVRDVESFRSGDFPCFARGVTHRGPYKSGPTRLNVPVAVGGQVIHPGDVLVGDADGVVAFARDRLGWVVERARAKLRQEEAILAEIAAGAPQQEWLHGVLAGFGIAP